MGNLYTIFILHTVVNIECNLFLFGDGWCTFRITSPTYPGPGQCRPNVDRFTFGLPISSDKQLPGVGAQSGFDRFKDGLHNMTGSELRNRLPGRNEGSDPTRTPEAKLMDIVTHLQLEVEALKFGPLGHSTLGGPTSPVRSKPMVFTSTKVPKFFWLE